MEFIVFGPEALPGLMPELLAGLKGRKKVALYGEMGAGKTTLVKALCTFLGVVETTTSPSYSLINEYAYADQDGNPAIFYHLDLYRLHKPEEAQDIGLEELLDNPWFCFIEWPELVEGLLPSDIAKIRIEVTGETTRKVTVQ